MTTLHARLVGRTRAARVAGAVIALAALAAVFASYLDPQLVFALANRAWACL